MGITKVGISIDIENIKAEKMLTAKVCCIDRCEKIGTWVEKRQCFALTKGMCGMHYKKLRKYGEPLTGAFHDGRRSHQLYSTWYNLRDRITNEKSKKYPSYGGRGLKMEESWISYDTGFWQFVEDIAYMEDCPSGHTLDRKDNNIGYFVGNLRWSNSHQQNGNKRNSNETVGVCWRKQNNKWRVQLTINKILVLNAYYDTYEDAIKARKEAEIKHGIFISNF